MLGLLQLPNASIHALGHILVLGSLGFRHEQQLQLQLPNRIRCLALHRRLPAIHDGTSSTSHAVERLDLFRGPLVEARDVDGKGVAVGLLFVVFETDVGAGKRAVFGNEVVKQVPRRWL